MCIWDSCVYQKGVLCFVIHKSYVRSIKRYCFVRKYAAIPVQIIIIIIIIIIINTDHMKFAASFIFFWFHFVSLYIWLYVLNACI
jgi:uncharacterized integral membrane protein